VSRDTISLVEGKRNFESGGGKKQGEKRRGGVCPSFERGDGLLHEKEKKKRSSAAQHGEKKRGIVRLKRREGWGAKKELRERKGASLFGGREKGDPV